MTPSDMIALGKDLLGEVEGSAGDASPLAWNRWLLMAARELCQATDCHYRDFVTDLAAGQSQYCAAPLYKLVKATVTLSDGVSQRSLAFVTARSFAGEGGTDYINWQVAPAAASGPDCLVTQGDNRFLLDPAPTYTLAGGLTVEGYGVPDDAWVTGVADCPLPARVHEAVVYKAALLRCIQFPPANPNAVAMLQQQFTAAKGMLEGQLATMTSATRQRMW